MRRLILMAVLAGCGRGDSTTATATHATRRSASDREPLARVRVHTRVMRAMFCLLIACGSSKAPAPRQPVQHDGCVTVIAADRTTATCSERGRAKCTADVPITFVNCDTAPVTVTKAGDESGTAELPHVIAPGVTWTVPARVVAFMHGETSATVLIFVEITAPTWTKSETVDAGLTDDRGLRARAACTACNGDWSQHTNMGGDDCVCRTHDRGKQCEGPNDCEGWCERDHFVAVGDGLGYEIGKCSEWVEALSCSSPILEQHKLGPDLVARECRD